MSFGVPPALGPADLSLQDYFDILRRRKWIILQTLAVVVAIGVVTTAMTTPIYRASGKLYVESPVSQINTVNSENPLAGLLALSQPDSVQTQVQLLQSGPFLEEVYSQDRIPRQAKGISPSVMVAPLEGTNLIQVSVDAADPKQAADLVNGMLRHQTTRARIVSGQGVKDALEYVDPETLRAKSALDRAEADLIAFRKKNRIPEMMAQAESRTRELVDLETRAREVETTMAQKSAQLARAQRLLKAEPEERLRVATQPNTRLPMLQNKIDELEYQREALLQDYKPTHPRVRSIEGLLEEMKRRRAEEGGFVKAPVYQPNPRRERLENDVVAMENDLETLKLQKALTQVQLEDRRKRVNDVGGWEQQLAALTRTRNEAEKAYEMLVGKLQDLRIRERANRSFTRIIETAGAPPGPIRPRKTVNVLLATLAGCFFGICMAFLQEFLDDRINSPEDSDRMVGLPGLAHIPLIPGDGAHLITALDPHSPITESYRGLRSSIMFSAIEAPIHTLLVSSTMKGEGKSLTSINLAIAMAYEGKRVILVDADLRRPNIHRVLDLPGTPGLTDVLAGQATLEESLMPTGVRGFSVLASGSIPPNPAELLNSEPMERLIEALRGCADIVIFDTPPCLPVIDAQVLAAKVDGVVLVAEMGEARKAAVQHARRLFDQAHARTLGIVFNKMTESLGEGYLYRRSYYVDEPKAIRNGKAPAVNGNGQANGHAAFALKPLDTDRGAGGEVAGWRGGEGAAEHHLTTPPPHHPPTDTRHPTPDTRIGEEDEA